MRKRTSKKKKDPNDYPHFSVRVERGLLDRINALRAISGLSYGQIFAHCARRHLPDLEKFHAAK